MAIYITVTLKGAGSAQIDDKTWLVNPVLAFKIDLFGQQWNALDQRITLSSNGVGFDYGTDEAQLTHSPVLQWIRFGGGSTDAWSNNQELPAKNVGKNVLFPFWSDLQILKPYSVSYTYNNKGITFDWQTVHYGDGKNKLVHFQVVYNVDLPGFVQYKYLADSDADSLKPNAAGKKAVIGVQSGESFLFRTADVADFDRYIR